MEDYGGKTEPMMYYFGMFCFLAFLVMLPLYIFYFSMQLLNWIFIDEPDPLVEKMREIRRLEDPET